METDTPSRIAIPLDLTPRAVPAQAQMQHLSGTSMGTTWSVKFMGSQAAAQTMNRKINAALDCVIAQMSLWDAESDISRFNRRAAGERQTLPVEFATVITAALRIADESDGAYDPTVGALVDLWGFGPAASNASSSLRDIARAHEGCGWRHLEWDVVGRHLRRNAPGRLDLNGIAKGFAVDLVMSTLQQNGLHHALVNIGGELSGSGVKSDGTPWWVGIDRPVGLPSDIAPPLRIALHELAIATSGCERGYRCGDRHLSHTIDPRSGRPIDNGTIMATVLHPSCMEADAYATALMVLGADAGMAFADRYGLAAALLHTTAEGAIGEHLSPALQAMLA